MRLLIVGLNYLPESTSIGPYTADLAEYMQQRGHAVQVVTAFPMAPQWRIWDGYRGKRCLREQINGVPVLRTYVYVPKDPSRALRRILFDTSFAVSSFFGGMAAGPLDLVVVISPPLQLGLTGWLLGKLRGAPLFFHIKDLVPDAAVVTGMLSEDSLPVRFGRALERLIYKRARGIGVICDGFKQNLMAKRIPGEKIALLPDYIDLDFMRESGPGSNFRAGFGIDADSFLVMYSGSVALKQGLNTFVEAAAEFNPGDRVTFYLVGEGPSLPRLEELASKLRVSTLKFLPLQPRQHLPDQLSAANALVITQKKAVTDVVFPGKLLYCMAAGRPILASVSANSETGQFIAANEVGVVVPPEDPRALAEAIRFLQGNPDEAERMGRNGRRVAEQKFDRRLVLNQFASLLEQLSIPRATGKAD